MGHMEHPSVELTFQEYGPQIKTDQIPARSTSGSGQQQMLRGRVE